MTNFGITYNLANKTTQIQLRNIKLTALDADFHAVSKNLKIILFAHPGASVAASELNIYRDFIFDGNIKC